MELNKIEVLALEYGIKNKYFSDLEKEAIRFLND